ncbi:hypothetical protein DVQ84_05190 [Yersinia enterocolitica]|nr:hypothetical protein [Yersinia enterocolitica]QBP99221.1 hypothetical protein YEY1_10810 [Yersinia enterocolitica subsp. palearctica]EKN4926128.1 hypothetical protein [Yersinia enterocolitica]EKN4930261.1 hypothetical protein [Yersinia enterocolitica]EKN5012373.1 hypothetical protein [Yersinia enterocolitica]
MGHGAIQHPRRSIFHSRQNLKSQNYTGIILLLKPHHTINSDPRSRIKRAISDRKAVLLNDQSN